MNLRQCLMLAIAVPAMVTDPVIAHAQGGVVMMSAGRGSREPAIHAGVSRRDLPHEALLLTMRAGTIFVNGGTGDSVTWSLSVNGHSIATQSLPAYAFRAGPAGGGYDVRLDLGDTLPRATLTVDVPRNLRTLRLEMHDGVVLVHGFDGEVTISSEHGRVIVGDVTGPTLIEAEDGSITANIGLNPLAANAGLNVLGRNGDIELTLPVETRANLDVEAHQGVVVDAPYALVRHNLDVGKNGMIGPDVTTPDTTFTVTPLRAIITQERTASVLKLRDDELRTFHRQLNGGGPEIRLVTLNGNVTIHHVAQGVAH